MAEIEVVADFSTPTNTTKKLGESSRSIGGLIGWKCARCNCQNQLNEKSCRKCNHVKQIEINSKSKVEDPHQILGKDEQSFSSHGDVSNNGAKGMIISRGINRAGPKNKDSYVMGNNKIQEIPQLLPEFRANNKNSSQWAENHRGFPTSQVQDIQQLFKSNVNEKGDARNLGQLGGLMGHNQVLIQPQIGAENYQNRSNHNSNSGVGFNNKMQNVLHPLMDLEINQRNQSQTAGSNRGRFQPQGREMDRTLLHNINSNHNTASQFGGVHRGFNSHVQELPPLQGMDSSLKNSARWGGNTRDQFREQGNESNRWNQGFDGFYGGQGQQNYQDKVLIKLEEVFKGKPTNELATIEMTEKKFNMRARLFIGNLGDGTTEQQLKDLIGQYGEVGETFFQKEKRFAFFRMATRTEAECAKRALDGYLHNGRNMKVRLSPHQGAIKVSNLSPWVSNELLYLSLSIFGDIERAFVSCDERGQSKEEGVVEFVNKHSAMEAVRRCSENCFFLTTTLRPIFVELMDGLEPDEDGLQDHMLQKRNQEFSFERSSIPRFAKPESFEFEYGNKWKQLYEMKRSKLQALDREMKLEESKLIAQMEFSRYEHETESLRATLRQKEVFCEQQKHMWTMKQQQMDALILREKEKRKALNSSLAKDTRPKMEPKKNLIGSHFEIGSHLNEKASSKMFPAGMNRPERGVLNHQLSTMPFNSNGSVHEKFEKEKIHQMFQNQAIGNNIPSNDTSLAFDRSKHASDNGFLNKTSTHNNSSNQYVGKFEKEINQMFPHLANFNATFANADLKPVRKFEDPQPFDQKNLDEKKNTTQLFDSDPNFGSINPLLQPPPVNVM